jgi:alpha-tubulin suppressor-like RCC1 family protein
MDTKSLAAAIAFVLPATGCATTDVRLPRDAPPTGDDAAVSDASLESHDDALFDVGIDSLDDAVVDAGIDALDACPKTSCAGQCVDTLVDRLNCGGCGQACGPGLSCASGRCGSPPASVAAGDGVACVVREDQSVWCWGTNQYGQLGALPSSLDRNCAGLACNPVPQRISGLTGVLSVSIGSSFACAREADGSVWCWGRNLYDVLGHSSATDPVCADPPDAGPGTKCNPTPSKVTFPTGVRIAAVAAGREVACALTETDANGRPSSDVYCWGENDHDSVGIAGGVPANVATPNKIGVFAGDVVAVDVGDDTRHVCAIRQDGTVWCWGDDFQGRIGVVPGMFPQLDCGGHHCTAIPQQVRIEGTLADAGVDGGDLALGAVLTGAQRLQLGSGASCVVKGDGTVWCWGNNGAAALANSGPFVATEDHPGARPIAGLPNNITGLVRHFSTSFAVEPSGAMWGWGENSYGELGTGAIVGQSCSVGLCVAPPAAVMSLAGVKDLAGGDHFFAAIKADKSVWTWGRNDLGQLGHAPGAGGDGTCTGADTAPCNSVPSALALP